MKQLFLICLCASVLNAEEIVFDTNFETSLDGWTTFQGRQPANVEIENGALVGRRSGAGGLVALTREFRDPQDRIQIEFSFAFGGTSPKGRSLNIWTHEPDGKDSSQFNLCIQGDALQQYDGRTRSWETLTRTIQASENRETLIWHRIRATVDSNSIGIDFWISEPGSLQLPEEPVTSAAYRSNLKLGAIDFVSGTRIAEGNWYLIDDLIIRGGSDLDAPNEPPKLPTPYTLWTGGKVLPPEEIPFVDNLEHRIIHQATADTDKFLHGAAILEHDGVFYANWANSPVDENSPGESLRGRRSIDEGKTWGPIEVVGPGFDGLDRRSHGVLFAHNDRVWTICSRFGVGQDGRKFDGLQGEAFVLNPKTNRWDSNGIVMENCWPYDEPVKMGNGDYITGGQSRDGFPVVAISNGDDFSQWDSVLIPFHRKLAPSFAETTVWAEKNHVLAVIRGGGGVAWVSTSEDSGRTWTEAQPSNLPMPRAKAYLGKLSNGQLYLISNLQNRDTLIVSTGDPGKLTLNQMWRIRHGRSEAPRFEGWAKGPQWSYPYGYEYDGKLYVVYSIGKEDCGLSVFPISALK